MISIPKEISSRTEEIYWHSIMNLIACKVSGISCNRVLDIGFGHGISSYFLGASATCDTIESIDISIKHVSYLKYYYQKYLPLKTNLPIQGSMEHLPFKDDVYDIVLCRSSLQYVNVHKALEELSRILNDGGKIHIIANLSSNPFVKLFRSILKSKFPITEYASQQYISISDINVWASYGFKVSHKEYHLFTPLFYPLLSISLLHFLIKPLFLFTFKLESILLSVVPILKKFCWYSYIELKRCS